MFEMLHEKFKKGQAERNRELKKERKRINKNYTDDDDEFLQLPRENPRFMLRN